MRARTKVAVTGLVLAGFIAAAAPHPGPGAPRLRCPIAGTFIVTSDGKYVLVPPGGDTNQMLLRFPGGRIATGEVPKPEAAGPEYHFCYDQGGKP
jgi:hypothetical protein